MALREVLTCFGTIMRVFLKSGLRVKWKWKANLGKIKGLIMVHGCSRGLAWCFRRSKEGVDKYRIGG